MGKNSQVRSWYKQRTSSDVDVGLFFCIFIAGAISIIWFKYLVIFNVETQILWLKQEKFQQVLVVAIPCTLLIVYAAIIKFVPRFRLREDQAGDNCYYLGFLFTLVSLAIALYHFAKTASSTERIIENFGIALASTIIGLMLRVVFNQMRQDTVDIEREARLELAGAAQRLRSELDQSVFEFNAFRRSMQQSVADGIKEMNEKASELLKESLDSVTDINLLRRETQQTISKGFEDVNSKLRDILDKDLVRYEELVNSRTERINETLTAFTEISTQLKTIAGSATGTMALLHDTIEKALSATDVLEARDSTLENLMEKLNHFAKSLSNSEVHLNELSKNIRDSGKDLVKNSRKLNSTISDETSQIKTKWEDVVKTVADNSDQLTQKVTNLANVVDETLVAISKSTDNLNQFETQVERLPEVMKKQIEELSTKPKKGYIRRLFSNQR